MIDYSPEEISTMFKNYLGSNVGLYISSKLSRNAKNAHKVLIAFCDLCLLESFYEATRAQKKQIKDLFLKTPVTVETPDTAKLINKGREEFLEILSYF